MPEDYKTPPPFNKKTYRAYSGEVGWKEGMTGKSESDVSPTDNGSRNIRTSRGKRRFQKRSTRS